MNKSIWEWLEIEPTGEISEIRAAYARQVKKYHPEDTPEEFEQLQKAYKSALRQARAAKRTETVPQSVQAGVTSELGATPDLEIAGTPDEVESEIVSDSEYDFAEVGKDEPEQQCLKEIEYIIMNPYLRNTEEAWNIFFNRERYRQLFKKQEFCEKMQDRICRMWGLQRKTLFLIEQQFKAEGYEQLIEKKEWKQKKSFIRNLHIISYKNKKTQKQKNLNKLLENQTNGLEDYMDLYMNYTSQSYGAVYEEYRINRCQFKQMLISIIILILFMIISCFNAKCAWSDICYEIKENAIARAEEILKHQKEIYQYCSICQETQIRKITIKDVKSDSPLLINNEAVDLAHIYYKEGDDFVNLGVASGCISENEHNIKAKLDDLPDIHYLKEGTTEKAKEKAKKAYEDCVEQNKSLQEHQTTAEMVRVNTLINNCLTEKIKQEIAQGFDEDMRQGMYQDIEKMRKSISDFYGKIYSANKYCEGRCGTISTLLPYVDEGSVLIEMLEKLFYLNINKNGY